MRHYIRFLQTTVLGVVAAGTALAPAQADPKPTTLRLSPKTVAMPKCRPNADTTLEKNTPRAADVVKVIRVIIPRRFDPAAVNRNVRWKVPASSDTNEDADDDNENGTINDYPAEPFHVDLRSISTSGKYAMIRVILKDRDYKFFDNSRDQNQDDHHTTPYSEDIIRGIGKSEPYDPEMCGAHLRRISTNKPVAIFYIRMSTGSGSRLGGFNIGIVPRDYPETPLFIDPKVINNG